MARQASVSPIINTDAILNALLLDPCQPSSWIPQELRERLLLSSTFEGISGWADVERLMRRY